MEKPPLDQSNRTRLLAAVLLVPVIGLGLLARSYRPDADTSTLLGFLATYTGDTLWPVMFCLIFRFLWPAVGTLPIVIGTFLLTQGIEFLQLWKPPLLQWMREKPILGFLLGTHFLWSDVVCISVGCVLAWLLDSVSRNKT